MAARTILSSIPGAGITVDGIVDVLGGKSIVVKRIANGDVLKGQALELSTAGEVKTATQDVVALAGVAVSSAADREFTSALRQGIARLPIKGTAVIGDQLASWGDGYVCKLGELGKDGVTATTKAVAEVSDVGAGYVDVEIALLGKAV